MERREDGAKVIVVGTTAYAMLAGIFGVVCYASGLADCKQTGGGITDCLPAGPLTSVVRLALASSMIVGYPCLLYPVTEILEDLLFNPPAESIGNEGLHSESFQAESIGNEGLHSERFHRTEDVDQKSLDESLIGACGTTGNDQNGQEALESSGHNEEALQSSGRVLPASQDELGWRIMLRVSEVFFTVVLAIGAGSSFSAFTNVVGAFLIPVAGFLLPPLVHIFLRGGWKELSASERTLDGALILLFVLVFAVGVSSLWQ